MQNYANCTISVNRDYEQEFKIIIMIITILEYSLCSRYLGDIYAISWILKMTLPNYDFLWVTVEKMGIMKLSNRSKIIEHNQQYLLKDPYFFYYTMLSPVMRKYYWSANIKYFLTVEMVKRPTALVITINWNHNEVAISIYQAELFLCQKLATIKYFKSDCACIMYFRNTNQDPPHIISDPFSQF